MLRLLDAIARLPLELADDLVPHATRTGCMIDWHLARARLLHREILGAVEPGERVDAEGVFWRLERPVDALTFAEVEREFAALRGDGAVDLVRIGVYQRRAGAP